MSYKHVLPIKLQSAVDLSRYCHHIFAPSSKEQHPSNLPPLHLNTIAVKNSNDLEHRIPSLNHYFLKN